jgi:hypothetical protein
VVLPKNCSAKVQGEMCQLPPSYTVSVNSADGEYLLAVVCEDHKSALKARLVAMQHAKKIPYGEIHFQPIKPVVTDCVMGITDDYVELNERMRTQSKKVS